MTLFDATEIPSRPKDPRPAPIEVPVWRDRIPPLEGNRPFANGTEGSAWMSVWCGSCRHDHAMHIENGGGPGCEIIAGNMFLSNEPGYEWPTEWIPEPPGGFSLPSRMVCTKYAPCRGRGCHGDPQPDVRRAVIDGALADWATHLGIQEVK